MLFYLFKKSYLSIFSTTKENGNDVKKCDTQCSEIIGYPKYFGEDKICIDSCSIFEFNKYHNEKTNDYACLSHCDKRSENRFTYISTENGDTKFYCLNKCKEDKKYYTQEDFICDSKCNEPNNYLIPSQNICTDKCPIGQVANPTTKESDKAIS